MSDSFALASILIVMVRMNRIMHVGCSPFCVLAWGDRKTQIIVDSSIDLLIQSGYFIRERLTQWVWPEGESSHNPSFGYSFSAPLVNTKLAIGAEAVRLSVRGFCDRGKVLKVLDMSGSFYSLTAAHCFWGCHCLLGSNFKYDNLRVLSKLSWCQFGAECSHGLSESFRRCFWDSLSTQLESLMELFPERLISSSDQKRWPVRRLSLLHGWGALCEER